MYTSIPSKTTCVFYGFIGAIYFFCLKNQPVICLDDIIYDNWAQRNGYPAICDHLYRNKYFKDKKHRDAVQAALLYDPPPNISQENLNSQHFYFRDPFGGLFPRFKNHISRSLLTPKNSSFISYEPTKISNFFSGILTRRKNFGALKRQKLVEFRRKIISKNKCYQKKSGIKKRKRKTRKHGSTFFRGDQSRRLHRKNNNLRNTSDNRRWGDWGKLGDSGNNGEQNLCKPQRRIIGGQNVISPEVLPYMVFVDSGCGGGIISDMFVITAGHCVDGAEAPQYVHVGSTRLLSGCQYNVVGIWIHPQYSRKEIKNDIALLKVNPPFIWSPAIQPIKLSSKKAEEKTCGIVAGWDAGAFNSPTMLDLAMAPIPVVERKKCHKYGVRNSQFCGGYDNDRIVTCRSDSGGPFVVAGRIIGIVSYGYKCSKPHNPGIYEDVSFHRNWIRGITGF